MSDNDVEMRDAQGAVIQHDLQRKVRLSMDGNSGNNVDGEADFEVTNIDGAILSAGRLIRKGSRAVLSQNGSYLERGGERIELKMRRNTFYLPSRVCALEAQPAAEAPAVWGPPHHKQPHSRRRQSMHPSFAALAACDHGR